MGKRVQIAWLIADVKATWWARLVAYGKQLNNTTQGGWMLRIPLEARMEMLKVLKEELDDCPNDPNMQNILLDMTLQAISAGFEVRPEGLKQKLLAVYTPPLPPSTPE